MYGKFISVKEGIALRGGIVKGTSVLAADTNTSVSRVQIKCFIASHVTLRIIRCDYGLNRFENAPDEGAYFTVINSMDEALIIAIRK